MTVERTARYKNLAVVVVVVGAARNYRLRFVVKQYWYRRWTRSNAISQQNRVSLARAVDLQRYSVRIDSG